MQRDMLLVLYLPEKDTIQEAHSGSRLYIPGLRGRHEFDQWRECSEQQPI
jgi:hypothetical protein